MKKVLIMFLMVITLTTGLVINSNAAIIEEIGIMFCYNKAHNDGDSSTADGIFKIYNGTNGQFKPS